MSPEAQRVAIAEACGWKPTKSRGVIMDIWVKDGERVHRVLSTLPDYLSDLNAMHEAEKVLTVEQTIAFVMVLCDQLELPHAMRHHARTYWILLHATAAQRAEAFLRTVNKWQDA